MAQELLTRDQFHNAVFQRDKHKCVICKADGQDAHHIMERRLFPDGGYYLNNGATLCGPCHIQAEQTILSTEEIRRSAGILKIVIPPHAYSDQRYDKWLNPILDNDSRLRGELFDDVSVQKILAPVLHLFTDKVKYMRTYHLPWSPGCTSDDRLMNMDDLEKWNWEVVVSEKRDGENTTMGKGYIHARSLDYEPHLSRDKIKALHSQIAYNIPENWRVCGENLTAVHSLKYSSLQSIFEVFSIWDGPNCLSWDDTVTYAQLLGLETVPVLYRGIWNPLESESFGLKLASQLDTTKQEGYVIRPSGSFHMKDFKSVVGKYVRKNHVDATRHHWFRSKLEFNEVL